MTARKGNDPGSITMHPCFSGTIENKAGCVHVPVAAACNLQCRYCNRKFDQTDDRDDMAGKTFTPDQAVEHVRYIIERGGTPRAVVISGPGEPLANAAAFLAARELHREFPELSLCLSTNGLLLRDRLEQIVASGVLSLAITLNAFSPETAKKIYSDMLYRGRRYAIEDAAEFLLKNQWQGLMLAVDAGLAVTVNTIFIPDVNQDEIPLIAGKAGKLGAKLMNILSIEQRAEFEHMTPPDARSLAEMRDKCRPFISQLVTLPRSFRF